MHRRSRQFGALVVLVVLAASAWSQTARYVVPAASVGDDFSAYHQALDSAADLALANVVREAAMNGQIAEAATNTTTPPDATVLQQFAEPSVFFVWFLDLDDLQGAIFSVSVDRSVSSGGFSARKDL
jgi:hypothetical protein